MNNRIMAALFALALCMCLFIGVVPVDAEAASCTKHEAIYVRYVEKKEPTCSEDGYEAHWQCDKCGDWLYSDKKTTLPSGAKKALTLTKTGKHDQAKVIPHPTDNTKCHITCSCGYEYDIAHVSDELWHTEEGRTDHWNECTLCKKQLNGTGHRQVTVDNKDGKTHADKCGDCGAVINPANDHVLVMTKNADGTHDVKCKYCEYTVVGEAHMDEDSDCDCDVCKEPMHDYTGWNADGTNHMVACKKCKVNKSGAVAEAHKFGDFESNGDGSHSATCEICGYVSEDAMRCSKADKNGDHICDDCGGRVGHIYNMSYMEKILVKDAWCDETGIKVEHWKCKVCDLRMTSAGRILTEEEVTIPVLGHDYVWAKAQENEHYRYCSRKGCKTEVVDRGPHTITYVSGTGANEGRHYKTCTVCGYQATTGEACEDILGDGKCECKCGYKMPHTTSNTKTVELKLNTCTTDGYIAHRHCDECGGNFTLGGTLAPVKDIVLKATGHNYVVKETRGNTHDVQCTNIHRGERLDGETQNTPCDYKTYVGHEDTDGDCRCDLEEASGDACGAVVHTHSYKFMPAQEATCSTEGFEAYYYFSPCNRMFADDTFTVEIDAPVSTGFADCEPGDWVNEGDNHVSYCEVCNEVYMSEAHTDDNGDNRCDECGYELSLEYVAEIPATCTTAGRAAHYVSDITGRSYWDAEGTEYISDVSDLVIPAMAHVDPATGMGPMATDKGNGTHEYKCLLCNSVTRTENHTNTGCFCTACGAANGDHVATTYDEQAATCDKAGHAAYVKCSCGKYFDALGNETTYKALETKPVGHSWAAELHNDDSSNKHYAVCGNCGAKNYGEHALTTSDPLSGNYHQMICSCGEVKLEKHYDNNGDNVCDDAGCKRDLSGKKVEVNNHDSTTVVTGDKNNTVSTWSWLKNWLTNTTPSNGGGSSEPTTTSKGNTTGSTSSQSTTSGSGSSNSTPSTSGSSNGSTGSSNTTTPSQSGSNTTTEATGVLQYIVSFINWLFSGFTG